MRVKQILQRNKELQDGTAILGFDELSEEDKIVVNRACFIQQFLSQNTYMADKFTNIPGHGAAHDFESFQMVCNGEVDHIAGAGILQCWQHGLDVERRWSELQRKADLAPAGQDGLAEG